MTRKYMSRWIPFLWFDGVVYEDELDVTDEEYDYLFPFSKVDGVRVFPKLLVNLIKEKQ